MDSEDEHIEAEDVQVTAEHVIVNNSDAWTPQDVRDNVLWTKVGALAAVCSVIFSVVAIAIAFTH
jgi:hypothetical protein